MRNIVVHDVVRGRAEAGRVVQVIVRGVAFGLRSVEVSVRGEGAVIRQTIDTAPDAEFRAVFDERHDLASAGLRCGELLRAQVSDAADRDGCYSSVETRLACDGGSRADR